MPTKKCNFTEDFREEAVRLALTSDQPHHETAQIWELVIHLEQMDKPAPSSGPT